MAQGPSCTATCFYDASNSRLCSNQFTELALMHKFLVLCKSEHSIVYVTVPVDITYTEVCVRCHNDNQKYGWIIIKHLVIMQCPKINPLITTKSADFI